MGLFLIMEAVFYYLICIQYSVYYTHIRILYFLKTERPKFNNMLNLKIFRVVRNANSII